MRPFANKQMHMDEPKHYKESLKRLKQQTSERKIFLGELLAVKECV